MTYLKIIQDGKIVEVSTVFVRVSEKYHILLVCDADHAQFVQSRNGAKIYHTGWLRPLGDDAIAYEDAEIVAIDRAEYEDLVAILDDGEPVYVPNEPESENEPEPETPYAVEKPMSISEMRERIGELTELVTKLTNLIGGDNHVDQDKSGGNAG